MSRARHFGLDLAWSAKNPTGACALDDDGRIVDERMLGSDGEIVEWIADLVDGLAVVAIDAPLQVPNETGRRPCESELHREYGSRKAGPHSSNRSRLVGLHGSIRGEVLARRLAELGFGDPWARNERTLIEVYPHPAMVEAFGLEERLKYKKGSVGERRQGMRQLSALVALLESARPPLIGDPVAVEDEDRGATLKAIEDRLDARICAWVAAIWGSRPDRVHIFGDAETGHIAVPVGAFVEAPPELGPPSAQPQRRRKATAKWEPSRQLREILSWRIATTMLRKYPDLRLIEAHPGGGMSDCLALLGSPPGDLYLNRDGSATVFGGAGVEDVIWTSIWTEAAAGDSLRRITDRISRMLGRPDVAKLPPSTYEVIAFRVVSALLEAVGLSSPFWHIRMGYYDSAGMVFDPIPHERYEPFPHMTERLRVQEPDDFLDQPGYRFWFVMRDDEPVLAFERNGVFENRSGLVVDAAAEYRANGRKLWPIVTQVAGDVLP